jgi:hypothetical protein
MMFVSVEKVQRMLVNWAARCDFESRKNLACAQSLKKKQIKVNRTQEGIGHGHKPVGHQSCPCWPCAISATATHRHSI